MSAIDPKETARYTGRLFGYFLTVAIVGGAITAGGAVLLRETNLLSSGSVDVGAEVIVGAALAGVGVLVLLAGFFAIVLNVVADGVRFGVEARTPESDTEPTEVRTPAWTPGQQRASPGRTPPPRRRPSARESERGRRGPRTQEVSDDGTREDETWKREVEEQLAEKDRTGQADRSRAERPSTAGTPAEPDEQSGTAHSQDATGGTQSRRRASGPDEGATGSTADTTAGATDRPASGVERDPGVDQYREPTADTGTQESETGGREPGTSGQEPDTGEPTPESDSEAWVSGDEVGAEERPEPDPSAAAEPPAGADDQVVSEGTDDTDRTDVADDDATTPAWLEEADEDDQEEQG